MSHKDLERTDSRRDLFRRFSSDAVTGSAKAEPAAETIADRLLNFGISRRSFLQFSAGMTALMGLPPTMSKAMADRVLNAKLGELPNVMYMSFQECTGCLESLVNLTSVVKPFSPQPAAAPFYYKEKELKIKDVLLNVISLNYQETLMAAAGKQAEAYRKEQIEKGKKSEEDRYLLVVDGSVPAVANSGFFVSGGQSGVTRFMEAAEGAAAIVAVGSCASWGGISHARPNPTGALSIYELLEQQNGIAPTNLINIPGCPPIAEVIVGVIYHYITIGIPELDSLLRPKIFYGLAGGFGGTARTVHTDCLRAPNFRGNSGLNHAKSFEDLADPDKALWCLVELGCKGPRTYNACTTVQWNQGISYPMKSGHHCIGCAEPNFWDGVYSSIPTWDELKAFTEDPEQAESNFAIKGLYDPY